MSEVIYNLTSSGRGLQNQDGTARNVSSWQNITLTNMERPLTDETMQGGAINRVLDFEIREGNIFQNVPALLNSINENHGVAGPELVETLLAMGEHLIPYLSGKIADSEAELKQALSEVGIQKTDKQIKPLAILFAADELIDEILFQDGIHINQKYGLDTLKDVDEVSEGARAYKALLEKYELEYSKFSPGLSILDSYEWGSSENGLIYFKKKKKKKIVR